jgi:uncharacterized hydantoinase/oxoprolinase family protein
MQGGDLSILSPEDLTEFALRIHRRMLDTVVLALTSVAFRWEDLGDIGRVIVSGIGEKLARQAVEAVFTGVFNKVLVTSLNDELGPTVSACAPAYAVAVLAAESRS